MKLSMSRLPVVRSIQSGLIGLAVLVCGAALPAAEIKDEAGYFSPAAVKQANEKIAELEKKHQTQIHVETYATVPEADKEASASWSAADRGRYFNSWITKRAGTLNAKGVFILICKNPSHLDVATGKSLKSRGFGPTQRAEVQNTLLGHFRKKEYDAGLTSALADMESSFQLLTAPKAAADHQFTPGAGRHAGQPHAAQPRAQSPFGNIGRILIVVVVGLLVMGVVSSIFRAMSGGGAGSGGGMGGYGGGGGGFMSSLFGSIAGAMAGNWLYDSMFGHHNSGYGDSGLGGSGYGGSGNDDAGSSGNDFDGGDFGGGDFGGGDSGGGGDFGGGDGGGDF